jgi:hypothetical protein
LCSPTPALPNQPVDLGDQLALRFNEWMATNSAGADKDWLEVYNLDPLPVVLGGLVPTGKLTYPPAGEKVIPALSFIAGNGFIRFWCDSKPGSGADHLNFKLSSSNGETNSLYSAAPNFFLIDQISFPGNSVPGGLQRAESMGRLPDGGTNIVKFPPGRDSPGASNFLPITNVVMSESGNLAGGKVTYVDGTKATMLLMNGLVGDFTFAARIKGLKEPLSTLFYLPPTPNVTYSAQLMSKAEELFTTGVPPYPIERTLLTTGLVEAGMKSLAAGKKLETPHLAIKYEAPKESGFARS